MSRKIKYKQYEASIKAAIYMTGRADLFPELNIPRTTALYWITNGVVSEDPILAPLTERINEARSESDDLCRLLKEKEALVKLLHQVFEIFGFQIRWKHIESAEIKSKMLDASAVAMESLSLEQCLREIDLSLSRYKRWRRQRRECGFSGTKSCPRRNANQLTFSEVQSMKRLVTSKEFSHFPIRSLHYYAKREAILFCSYSTWRKYIDQFAWKRPRRTFPEKKRKVGIRAKHPNEIWHLDVSYFILPDKTKCFVQAIIDNYSRYVVAWQVLDSYDGSKTADLLKKAIMKASGAPVPDKNLRLIVDGGGENRSHEVTKLEGRGHFKKQVAHFEISFSNSMVESLFRSMKHNYLFYQEITKLTGLKRHADFWFTEHNDRIPHSSFKGETPLERYNQTWNKDNEIRILVRHEEAMKMRVKENQKIFCEQCEVA